MARNGSGTFLRLFDWTDDAAAGIKIRADRMDDEMDGMATALTDSLAKDGQTPATGNFDFGGFDINNALFGAIDGTAAAPGVSFKDDVDTGFYRPAANTIGVVAGGSEVWRWGVSKAVTENLIVNPEFRYDQEGYSGTTSVGSATDYIADQHRIVVAGSASARWTASIEASGGVSGTRPWLKMLCTTADGSPGASEMQAIDQPLEAQAIQSLLDSSGVGAMRYAVDVIVHADGASSLSFPVTLAMFVRTIDGTARQYVGNVNVAAADTWERVVLEVPADSTGSIDNNSGQGLSVGVALYGGSGVQAAADTWENDASDYTTSSTENIADATNNYIGITAMKLEPGTFATPFVAEDYDRGLERCTWHFERLSYTNSSGEYIASGFAISTSESKHLLKYSRKRTAPTLSFSADGTFEVEYSGGNADCGSSMGGGDSGQTSARVQTNNVAGSPLTAGQGVALVRDGTDTTYIDVSARF